jgi:hypothetical protein
MKIEKGDSPFISETADWLPPFGGPVKSNTFDESPPLVARNVTSVSWLTSAYSEEEGKVAHEVPPLHVSYISLSIGTSSISSGSNYFEYLALFLSSISKDPI